MLLFIGYVGRIYPINDSISKHRMLLFIQVVIIDVTLVCTFQNIVCYCLSRYITNTRNINGNFKTSYVTVYQIAGVVAAIGPLHFKTSYVTVYQESLGEEVNGKVFQNIVCYCLSAHLNLSLLFFFSFQNIVCYCLSQQLLLEDAFSSISKHRMLLFIMSFFAKTKTSFLISKHRMLLFISLSISYRSCDMYFKTSYVTVYLSSGDVPLVIMEISKHRMLLFI
mgnify:CR=1 FL=1